MKLASKGSKRLPQQRLRQVGIALALAATTLDVEAAGLGRLNLMSGIGQPLRAEIELTAVARDEAGSLTARLARPDAFGQAGIEYGSALSGLRFSIQRRANGVPYLLVTSTQQINDPYLDVLVELSWSSGRLVREYTMLLDPPETRAARTEVDPGKTIVQAQSPAAATRAAAPTPVPTPTAPPADGGGTAPAASARRANPPAPASSGGEYVVKNGDTAMSIARANKPEDASLEQMLAVLYRDNPQAFTGNINRLMAGAALKLPDAATAQSLDAAEAHRIVAQSANFSRYRERVAQNAAEVPAASSGAQQASGRLSTQVQDNGAPASDARDRLQLSRPDANRPAAAGAAAKNGPRGPSVEEAAAKDRELGEARSRVAQLEKSVADLQELLKLKNQTLVDLQKNAAKAPAAPPAASVAAVPAPPPPAPAPAPAPVVVATPPVASPPPVAAPPVVASPAPAPAVTTPPAPVKAAPAPAPATSVTSEANWYDGLLDNTLLLVGLVVVLLVILGYVFLTMRRRRKLAGFEDSIFVDNSVLHANSVFGTTGGQSVDTANSGFHSNFVPVGGSLPEQSEVDPVAEADVYIAYGRDAQAEEILKEALRADPSRHAVRLKLLEIHAKRGDVKAFETVASEFYAATGGQGDDWKRAAALGASIDPRNPLYGEAAIAAPVPAAPATPLTSASDSGATAAHPSVASAAFGAAAMTVPVAFAASGLESNASDDAGKGAPPPSVDMTRTDPLPRPAEIEAPPSMDLDFDLGLGGQGSVAPLHAAPTDAAPSSGDDATLDFDVSQSEPDRQSDPFTASAFAGNDSAIRTAVNLPAFRARADQPPPSELPGVPRADADGFTASDIFGTSITGDADALYSEEPPQAAPPAGGSFPFHDPETHAFDKTEPLDAFSNINLDLDDTASSVSSTESDFGEKTDVWQAMATKLDLALAYSDIGDRDGARELLEEVVRSGDQAQADRARTLIGSLD